MYNVNQIRSIFLDFFRKKNHKIISSSSLVPNNDPTLLFTNSGMVQFKNIFTGFEEKSYSCAASVQKCLRAGGKHNDLENVGYTTRHHTFFEMLGNFSFGDYFKEQAILLAWEFLTKELSLNKEKLLITVYHSDDDSFLFWKKITGFSEKKIIRISTKDNFWSMGETGPCGPCSEIFYCYGNENPENIKNLENNFIEIWNLVFMQYEKTIEGKTLILPYPSIDTGMGLERISSVLQGVNDNYNINLFRKLISSLEELTGVKSDENYQTSYRIISDHLRSSSFLIADGVFPSNEGRGYVLRRIIRRSMRYVRNLNLKKSVMCHLIPVLISEMGQFYPELIRAKPLIKEILILEEERFGKTLEKGLDLLKKSFDNLESTGKLDGEFAFKLYDTYGFPVDLIQDILRKHQIVVDINGFNEVMRKKKEETRSHWSGSGDIKIEKLWIDLSKNIIETEFIGYNNFKSQSIIISIIKENQSVDRVEKGDVCCIIVNKTPFYAESGGQIGDSGRIFENDFLFDVLNTKIKIGKIILHYGKVINGFIEIGNPVKMEIDVNKRKKIQINHSALHLLNACLRDILGNHITQKGSLVSSDRFRLDFSHFSSIDCQDLMKIENKMNNFIMENTIVTTQVMSFDQAISEGSLSLFGKKYKDLVRVVCIGNMRNNVKKLNKKFYSVELCGGTHVLRTGDIGIIHIISERSISSGIRRIESLTGNCARLFLIKKENYINDISILLKTNPEKIYERVSFLMKENNKLHNYINNSCFLDPVLEKIIKNFFNKVEKINDIKFIGCIIPEILPSKLKILVDVFKKKNKSGIISCISIQENRKARIIVGVTNDLIHKINAIDLIKLGIKPLGGKTGGGNLGMAQGGGPEWKNSREALNEIRKKLHDIV